MASTKERTTNLDECNIATPRSRVGTSRPASGIASATAASRA
jgi:hypothetical protein